MLRQYYNLEIWFSSQLNRQITLAGEYEVAGTPALYERDRDREKVRIPGPIKEDIAIYVRNQSRSTIISSSLSILSNSIHFSSNLVLNNIIVSVDFERTLSEFRAPLRVHRAEEGARPSTRIFVGILRLVTVHGHLRWRHANLETIL